MSGSQQLLLGGIPTAVPVDPYFYSVTSLLHGDGTNGGQNNTFLDSSSNNFTITRNGNTTQGSFSPFSQTGWSNYFDGSGDYLTVPDNAALDLGTGNFTIEAWIYPTSVSPASNYSILAKGASSATGTWQLDITSGSKLRFQYDSASSIVSSASLVANTWTHVVAVREGTGSNQTKLYINGVNDGTGTVSSDLGDSSTVKIGQNRDATTSFLGYISNARIVKGTAVYTAAFTPPTAPLTAISGTSLLTCQSNRFIDNSSNAFAITRNGDVSVQPFSPFNPTTAYSTSAVGGSGYFDGSGDYLSMTSGTSLGSGDFTIGCWVYLTAAPGAETPVGSSYNYYTSGQNGNFVFRVGTTNLWRSFDGQGNQASITGTYTWTLNTWMYMAWVRSGSTLTVYKDGVSLGSVTDSKTLSDSANGYAIGADRINGSIGTYLTGYLSGFRILVGTADSTVPTAPPTAIANTQLLCNFTNGAIFDNAAVADYETVGNAQISTSVKKYGTGSLAFDGTGDWLAAPPTPQSDLGSGDFTIECWLYRTASGATFDSGIVSRGAPSTSNGFVFAYTSSNVLTFNFNYAGAIVTGTTAIPINTWTHVAVCRIGTTFKLFVNGNVDGTATSSSSQTLNASDVFYIGRSSFDSGRIVTGYIDDLRISKGIARYPYNFTPPTAELPNIGGTVTLTADPYYEYTTLLLPGNGTNGAQNNTFLDSSTNAFTITRNGNTTQGTFSPFSQTGWGAYFNGSSDYISVADSADFTMGSGDFTVQCWVYSTANSGSDQYILGQVNSTGAAAATSFQLYKKATSNVAEAYVYAGGSKAATGTAQIPVGQWTHLAMVRDGGTLRLYVNGSQDGTNATLSTTAITDSAASFSVGRTGDYNGVYFAGYVSNVSVVKGTCLFPSGTTFTPSTTPLSTSTSGQSVLLCQANRFIDTNTATTAKTVTVGSTSSIQAFSPFNPTASWSAATNGGSGYFDGSGDYLTIGTASGLNFGTGDFTLETWFYLTSTANTDQGIMSDNGGSFAAGSVIFKARQNFYSGHVTVQSYDFNSGGTPLLESTTVVVPNTWYHVAVVRSGNSFSLYVNGAREDTETFTGSINFNNNSGTNIGRSILDGASGVLTGYLSSLRAIKGTAQYSGTTLTVPTAPLTAITNTSLLCNFTNAGIYDATSKNDLETVGNAQISTTQSKFGGSSMYFDGAGDYLVGPWNSLTDLGAEDFTIEFWMYPTAVGQSSVTYLFYIGTSGNYAPILIGQAASGYGIVLYSSSTGSSWNLASGSSFGTATANAWNHVALTRYGADVRLFLNGAVGTTLNWGTTALLTGSSHKPNIGSATGVANTYYTGYMQDLRVTKGIARYTSNFTPPTTAFLTL